MAVLNRYKLLLAEKQLREGRKIGYEEIRRETGISTSTLSAWATNSVRGYRVETIDALCQYFSCEVKDLIVRLPDSALYVGPGKASKGDDRPGNYIGPGKASKEDDRPGNYIGRSK
jgi:putative transcriptional regulator